MVEHDDTTDPALDALLRRQFTGPVPDEGFSARVMRALPPRRAPRPWLLPTAAVAGCGLAWLALAPSPAWRLAAQEWAAGDPGAASLGVAVLMGVLALAGCAWSLDED